MKRQLRLVQYLALSLALLWTATYALQPVRPASRSIGIRLRGKPFNLDEYCEENLYSICAKHVPVQLHPRDEYLESACNNTSRHDIFLLDISVRSMEDINVDWIGDSLPAYELFKKKLTLYGESIQNDKFMYTHDVGSDSMHKISMARIPLEMYQKLTLARSLVEVMSHNTSVNVIMLSQFGEVILDSDMMSSLVSATQVQLFNMPSLKSNAPSGSSAHGSILRFLLPSSDEDVAQEIEDQWSNYYASNLQTTPPVQPVDATKKMSALEAAMIKASETLYASYNDDKMIENNKANGADREGMMRVVHTAQYVNDGVNIARALSSLPPNILNPSTYSNVIRHFADAMGCEYSEWGREDLIKEGCGAFVAVIQGNEMGAHDKLIRLTKRAGKTPAGVGVHFPSTSVTLGDAYSASNNIHSSTPTTSNRPIVLVGKGVCYDTGGINIKSANSMKTMKHDMAGSAAALGAFVALISNQDEPIVTAYPIECWLAIVENNISPTAFRPDDVVTAVTGTTIEVVHSDAEGRMLLADVLALASRKIVKAAFHSLTDEISPKIMIDFATLTGTCITSLSNKYVGAFSNKSEFYKRIVDISSQCGERIWPFPLDDDYEEDLKSDIADILQCRQPTEADHIYATSFLKKFVNPAVPWVHLDLGSAYKSGGLNHVPTDYTGSGVMSAVEIIKRFLG